MTPNISFYCATLLICLTTASACGTSGQNGNGQGVVISSDKSGESAETLYLDINKPSIEQAIDARIAASATPKFVQIEVTQVTNPKRHPLTFEVRYRSTSSNAPIYLGSFSLYPSDNPGKFLVATQGKVTGEGAIILSMMTPDKIDSRDVVRVAVKPFTLLSG